MADRVARAARSLGLHPFSPFRDQLHGHRVQGHASCNTCDGFACAFHAKNDLSASIPDLQERGLRLETNTMAVRLTNEGRRITEVEASIASPGSRAGLPVASSSSPAALARPICSWRQGSTE
jgi:choline dehydrogenase-like flavoprotein